LRSGLLSIWRISAFRFAELRGASTAGVRRRGGGARPKAFYYAPRSSQPVVCQCIGAGNVGWRTPGEGAIAFKYGRSPATTVLGWLDGGGSCRWAQITGWAGFVGGRLAGDLGILRWCVHRAAERHPPICPPAITLRLLPQPQTVEVAAWRFSVRLEPPVRRWR